MKYIKSIFLSLFSLLIISAAGCRQIDKKLTDAEIFANELSAIYEQQGAMRKEKLLQSLQEEYRKAITLSNISSFELLQENYELSETEKNYALLNYFDRALLYMQISILPAERDTFLTQNVKNALLYETGSVFMRLAVAENFLAKSLQNPQNDENRRLQSRIINSMDNPKIEYDALRINDLNASKNMPQLQFPANNIPIFRSFEEFRLTQSGRSPLFDMAKTLYSELSEKFAADLPLLLIKMLYKSPAALTQLYYNDTQLKKDFCSLLSELIHIHQGEQLFNAMQNTFALRSDMQQMLSESQNTSPQMLEAACKSELEYQSAYLKLLSVIGVSPFDVAINTEKTEQISSEKAATLKLMFNDVLNNVK